MEILIVLMILSSLIEFIESFIYRAYLKVLLRECSIVSKWTDLEKLTIVRRKSKKHSNAGYITLITSLLLIFLNFH